MQLFHTSSSLARTLGTTLDAISVALAEGRVTPAAFAGSADKLIPLFDRNAPDEFRRRRVETTEDPAIVEALAEVFGMAVQVDPAQDPTTVELRQDGNVVAKIVNVAPPAPEALTVTTAIPVENPHYVNWNDGKAIQVGPNSGPTGDPCHAEGCHRICWKRGQDFCSPHWKQLHPAIQENLIATFHEREAHVAAIKDAVDYLRNLV